MPSNFCVPAEEVHWGSNLESAWIRYHLRQNDYRCKSIINYKTIDPHQITNITDLSSFKNICPLEITVLTDDPDFDRVQDHGRLTAEHISKHSLSRLKITPAVHDSKHSFVCACSVVCVLCAWWCLVCCVSVGVCVCVCVGVCGATWHAENPPCVGFQTSPCVRSKRLRVYRKHARMCSTCARFSGTHGGVLNVHTETFGGEPLSLSPLVLPTFSLPSFSSLFSSLLFSIFFSLLFSLRNNDSDHSSSRLSLCTHGSDLPECQSPWASVHSLFGQHVRIMQETTVLV